MGGIGGSIVAAQDRHDPSRPQRQGHHRPRRQGGVAVLHARLSAGDGPRRRRHRRGRRRQPFPRLRRRHRRQLHRPLASGGRRRHRRPVAEVPAHVGDRLLLRAAGAARRGDRPHRADRRRRQELLQQLGHRGQRSGDQAGALPHQAAVPDRVPRLVPRPHARLARADVEPRRAAQGLRAGDHARRLPRAVPGRLSRRRRRVAGAGRRRVDRLDRGSAVREPRVAGRGRGHRRRADPGRGRLHRAADRVPPAARRAGDEARHPARRRRSAVGHGADREDVRVGALRPEAGHPVDRQGHRVGPAARRHRGPGRRHGLDARARTPAPSAATRSPAPPRRRRSGCSKAG